MSIKTFIKGFRNGAKSFGTGMSTIVNSILLILVYFIGVGLTSITAKVFRKSFLDRKIEDTDSYWSDLNLKKKTREEYYRQF